VRPPILHRAPVVHVPRGGRVPWLQLLLLSAQSGRTLPRTQVWLAPALCPLNAWRESLAACAWLYGVYFSPASLLPCLLLPALCRERVARDAAEWEAVQVAVPQLGSLDAGSSPSGPPPDLRAAVQMCLALGCVPHALLQPSCLTSIVAVFVGRVSVPANFICTSTLPSAACLVRALHQLGTIQSAGTLAPSMLMSAHPPRQLTCQLTCLHTPASSTTTPAPARPLPTWVQCQRDQYNEWALHEVKCFLAHAGNGAPTGHYAAELVASGGAQELVAAAGASLARHELSEDEEGDGEEVSRSVAVSMSMSVSVSVSVSTSPLDCNRLLPLLLLPLLSALLPAAASACGATLAVLLHGFLPALH